MGKFSGKKLLLLGSNIGSIDIVKYARENDAYVIVADYLPPEKSAAKPLANEHAEISTNDIEALSKLITDKKIDGVLAGISEFNLLNAMKLAEIHGLPFYCNKEQWNAVEIKNGFKNLCLKNAVPCPKLYYTGAYPSEEALKGISYPAVLKPVDAATSAGVHICASKEELCNNLEDAFEKSARKEIIVEQFVEGNEFTAHYTVVNGKAVLSCIDDRYPVALHEGKVTTLPIARIYPNVCLKEYLQKVNPQMIRLCEDLGLENAILFIQGMHNPKTGEFSIFEAGLRCAGEAPYRFIEKLNGICPLNIIVDHALLGKTDYCIAKEDPNLKDKVCGIISFIAKSAIVGKIEGLEEAVDSTPSVVAYESRYPVGSKTPDTDTLRQLMIRFIMISDSYEEMAEDIKYLNDSVIVEDEYGDNMVLKFDTSKLMKV